MSINELVEILADVTGISPVVEQGDVPPTFVDHVVLDPTRYRAEFGDAPLVSLRAGCATTWLAIQQEQQ